MIHSELNKTTNHNPRDPLLLTDFNNHLFLMFHDGYEHIYSLFQTLNHDDQVLMTKKLKEINQLIANLESKKTLTELKTLD